MNLPRTAADVLRDHVRFQIECIDRMYLNLYVPRLQYAKGIIGFLRSQLGMTVTSTAPLAEVTRAFNRAVERYAAMGGVPVIDLKKGQRKDDVMHQHLAQFQGTEGVLFIGRAQEKTTLFRTETRHDEQGKPYPWIVKTTGVVKHWYFYCVDEDFGPFFIKVCSYFPFTAKLCLNGHHWAQRQAAAAGLTFTALDNGFADVDDPDTLQAICEDLAPQHIWALVDKWLTRLPHPFTPDNQAAGYRYDVSILQAEFSLTQVLDRPVSGRIFFDQVIHDNLHLGRPDQVGLVFDRRILNGRRLVTPGQFRTRVITDGVTPSLHIDYKSTTVKQYFKLNRGLRTETTINNTEDFAIRKGLNNLPALREVGFSANRRLLGVQYVSHNPADGAAALAATCQPVTTTTGQRVAGLPLTHPRTQALLAALCLFRVQQPHGFTSRDLRQYIAPLLDHPDPITPGQASYDLRRLTKHHLIQRIPRTHRYRVTDTGIRHALFLTRLHRNVLNPGMAQLTQPGTRLDTATRSYDKTLAHLLTHAGINK
jgi:hypothetical protein